jgi:tetratricopeptide (TPR) repeat protein
MSSRMIRPFLFAFAVSFAVAGCGDEKSIKPIKTRPAPAPAARTPLPVPRDPLPPVVQDPAPSKVELPVVATEPEVDAIAALEAELEKAPDDAKLHTELARLHIAANHVRKARKHAERATELAPKSSGAWNTLGRVELLDKDYEEAIASFQMAIETNDQNSYAWNNLGLALSLDKQWDEAVEALETAVELDKVEPYMWNNLGMAYEHVDRLEDARDAYRDGAKAGSEAAKENLERLDLEAMPDDSPVEDEPSSADAEAGEQPLDHD